MDNYVQPVVLAVDDDADVREIIQLAIESALDARVILAEDGMNALRKARQLRPALILLDIHMPWLDGIEVLRTLKGSARTRQILTIAVSGAALTDRDQVLQAGFDDFLAKPFDLDELVSKVREHLSGVRNSAWERSA